MRPIAWYREFAPSKALEADVYALFSFVPAPAPPPPRPLLREIAFTHTTLCAPQFADGHVSFSFELGQTCDADGRWCVDSRARRGAVIGPLREVGRTRDIGGLPATIGVFFRPARVAPFLRVAISDLTDQIVAIDDVWGTAGLRLSSDLCELDEAARLDRLESALRARLARSGPPASALDVEGLAASVVRHHGRVSVSGMACAAGVSRQHLSREFRERIGVGPKLYSRLARFQSGLAYAGTRAKVDWARVAFEMGYADQSHMIAEFRLFSGLTPRKLASREWFHPFIVRTKAARRLGGAAR